MMPLINDKKKVVHHHNLRAWYRLQIFYFKVFIVSFLFFLFYVVFQDMGTFYRGPHSLDSYLQIWMNSSCLETDYAVPSNFTKFD